MAAAAPMVKTKTPGIYWVPTAEVQRAFKG